ncbi:hypothetical protein [Acidovorax sp. PRC11]|uniref:hypothetical protein n=1 Tax=Acidovorax sp. PRC11 TaxID=2962592 RepID=UPI002882862F|nr:hypothetical protein [Acidovorax sp. PRC11]MDT0140194.1 hypothetical protein [Acidovorax sp. PRC11]
MKTWIAAVACLLLGACSKQTPEAEATPAKGPAVSSAAVSTPAPAKPPFTSVDWKAAYKSAFQMKEPKTNEDGVAEYRACFDSTEDKKCGLFFFGKTDGFKKVEYLTPTWSRLNDIGDIYTYTQIYLAARECHAPSILIAPTVNQKGNWLFLRKASYMADGNVILEHEFDHNDVRRNADGGDIHEMATWLASEADIQALRNLLLANSTITRFTGDAKYITVEKKRQKEFLDDVRDTLRAYDRLREALAQAGGPACN